MRKENDAMARLRERIAAYRMECDKVSELETARLASLEDAERRREEAAAAGNREDYLYYVDRVRHFEEQQFEVKMPDLSAEINAVVMAWVDRPGEAKKALASAIMERIGLQAELLKELSGFPLPADLPWFDDDLMVRALVACGEIPAADWLWFKIVCKDRSFVDRASCPAKLQEYRNTIPTIAAFFPDVGRFGRP